MAIAVPGRIVLPSLIGSVFCPVKIRQNAAQTARVNYMSCACSQTLSLCIAQSADKTFNFQDASDVDYSSATEITFDIWENINGASVFSASLTGGGIVLSNPYTFTLDITGTESGAMSATRKYCEAWVTLSGGERRMVGSGSFTVQDTRKHD